MFVRKNRNRSGTVSVQIISKQRGSYRVAQTVGCSSDPDEIRRLVAKGKGLLYKELERLLNHADLTMSPKRANELTHNMYELEYTLPGESLPGKTLLTMDPEQQKLYDLIHHQQGAA